MILNQNHNTTLFMSGNRHLDMTRYSLSGIRLIHLYFELGRLFLKVIINMNAPSLQVQLHITIIQMKALFLVKLCEFVLSKLNGENICHLT